jgi:hypothetical protein
MMDRHYRLRGEPTFLHIEIGPNDEPEVGRVYPGEIHYAPDADGEPGSWRQTRLRIDRIEPNPDDPDELILHTSEVDDS